MVSGAPSLEDIALGLSRQPRFGGQARVDWTVLDHSLLCFDLALEDGYDSRLALLCLIHDAHESVMGDIPTTLKMPSQRWLQEQLDVRIYAELGVLPPLEHEKHLVDAIDHKALIVEGVTVGPNGWPADRYGTPAERYRVHCESQRDYRNTEDDIRTFCMLVTELRHAVA